MENKGVFFTIFVGIFALIVMTIIIFSGYAHEAVIDSTTLPSIVEIETVETTEAPTTLPPQETTIATECTEPTGPRQLTLAEVEPWWQFEAEVLAKVVWGEAGGCSIIEREKVIWCILNRVDHPDFPNTIYDVVTAPSQFHGYSPYHPIKEENYLLALRVISEWLYEKEGGVIDRPLAADYLYFHADGTGIRNIFTKTWG